MDVRSWLTSSELSVQPAQYDCATVSMPKGSTSNTSYSFWHCAPFRQKHCFKDLTFLFIMQHELEWLAVKDCYGTLNAYTSFQSVTTTYTNVLLFYVISFSVLIDCLLIYCVVFIVFYCVAYSLFFFYNFWWRLSVSH